MSAKGTLVTPLYLASALSKSKEKLLAIYGDHIDIAFREFVATPTKEDAERFPWLKDKQAEMLKIGSGSMSPLTLAGVLALNCYVISVSLLYPFLKFGVPLRELPDRLFGFFVN